MVDGVSVGGGEVNVFLFVVVVVVVIVVGFGGVENDAKGFEVTEVVTVGCTELDVERRRRRRRVSVGVWGFSFGGREVWE